MDKKEFALKQHEAWEGKIEVISRAKIDTPEELSVAYTPGVAEPCLKIADQQCTGISWYFPWSTGCAGEGY